MPGFIVGDNPQNQAEWDGAALVPGAAAPPPMPWYGALEAGFDNGIYNQMLGAREGRLDEAFWRRQQDIERRTGQKLRQPFYAGDQATLGAEIADPNQLTGVEAGGALQDAYEAEVDALRKKYPAQMEGVPTAAQLRAGVAGQLNAIAARAATAGQQHPLATAIGGFGGQVLDPINLSVGVLSGGLTEGLPLAGRILATSGIWSTAAAVGAPMRHAEAEQVGGPAYGLPEAEGDIFGGLLAGPLFEGGGAALKALLGPAWRAIVGRAGAGAAATLAEEDATRGAASALDTYARDASAVGRARSGADFEAATEALARGGPPPAIEPDADLGDLFGAPAPAAPLVQAAPAVDAGQGAAIYEQSTYRGRPIYAGTFDPAGLRTAPDVFQYKGGADAAGVTDRLRGVQAWDPTSSGKVIVYQAPDGALYIADGHQRLGLAKRLDAKGFEPRLDGYLFRASDGWSAREVRMLAALKNIREGQGTPLDAAKVFHEQPAALNDDSLPVSGPFIAQAKGLARLSPQAFQAVVNGVIPEAYGAQIGALAGGRPELHEALVNLLHKAEPANLDEAHALIHDALEDDFVKLQGAQAELFGDTPAQSLMIARAKLQASLLRSLRGDARLFAQLVRHADAIEAGGNLLARNANEAELATTNVALETIAKLGLRSGELGDAMTEAATRITAGAKVADAARPILARVKRALANGERLGAARTALLQPDAPLTAGLDRAAEFSEPGGQGQAEQIAPKPEDAAIERPAEGGAEGETDIHPGLFDDIGGDERLARAADVLKPCGPGGA